MIAILAAEGRLLIITETERLRIRHFAEADAEFIVALLNDAAFLAYVGDKGVRTVDEACSYLRSGPMASYAKHGFGLNLVELRDARVAIGMCGLLQRDSLPDVDLGFAFLPEYRSRGLAYEAAQAVMASARGDLGTKRILAITSPDNDSSIHLLTRLGFRFERMVRLSAGDAELKLFACEC